jgi:hypothetical protein
MVLRGDVAEALDLGVCVVRFMMVFRTKYASVKLAATLVVAKSPIVTSMPPDPGCVRNCSTMAGDSSMPWTGMPRWVSGIARRPVPVPSSSTAPTNDIRGTPSQSWRVLAQGAIVQ